VAPLDPQTARPAVVLVRPREEGNVGAAARAMANMGLGRLLLVEPAAPLGEVARAFAVGAREVLEGAERHPSLAAALAPFRRVVATTSSRERRLAVPLVTARELPAVLARDPPGTPAALVFGSEVGGLTNDELALAGVVVRIPCAPEQPTLNLAQAVLLVAYELHQARLAAAGAEPAAAPREPLATAADLDGLFAQATDVLAAAGFARDDTFAGVVRDLRQLVARAAPTAREVAILRGICRRVRHAIARGTAPRAEGESED
jgi:TrmH family RNA methyltransferase